MSTYHASIMGNRANGLELLHLTNFEIDALEARTLEQIFIPVSVQFHAMWTQLTYAFRPCCNFGCFQYRLNITGKWIFYKKDVVHSAHIFCNFYAELSESPVSKLKGVKIPLFEVNMDNVGANDLRDLLRGTISNVGPYDTVHLHIGFLPVEGKLEKVTST